MSGNVEEGVRRELSKRPKGILAIGWVVVGVIIVIGLTAQFIIMKRVMGIDSERQILAGEKKQVHAQLSDTKDAIADAGRTLAEYTPQVESLSQEREELLGELSTLRQEIETAKQELHELCLPARSIWWRTMVFDGYRD